MQASVPELISMFLSGSPDPGRLKDCTHHPNLKVFKKNEVIFREGEEVKAVYLLYEGKVLIVKKKVSSLYTEIETVESMEILGLTAVLTGLSYTTSAIAKSKVYVFQISKEEVQQMLMEYPELYFPIAEKLSKKIVHYESILSRGA